MNTEASVITSQGRRHATAIALAGAVALGALFAASAPAMTVTECKAAAIEDGLTPGRAMDDHVRRCIGAAEEQMDGTAEKRASKERAAVEAEDRSASVPAEDKVKPAAAAGGDRKSGQTSADRPVGKADGERKAAKADDRS